VRDLVVCIEGRKPDGARVSLGVTFDTCELAHAFNLDLIDLLIRHRIPPTVGEHSADYTMPSAEESAQRDAETDELLANSLSVETK
jgi:hypothetical protein